MNRKEVYSHKLLQISTLKENYHSKINKILELQSDITKDLMLSDSDVHELYILINFEISDALERGVK